LRSPTKNPAAKGGGEVRGEVKRALRSALDAMVVCAVSHAQCEVAHTVMRDAGGLGNLLDMIGATKKGPPVNRWAKFVVRLPHG